MKLWSSICSNKTRTTDYNLCMQRLAVVFLIFWQFPCNSQVVAEKTNHDFGDLYNGAPGYFDFKFTNTSEKVQYLLTINKPAEVSYVFSSKIIKPDSSIYIRFKPDASRKGSFNYEVEVYFSQPFEPFVIRLSGNVKESESNSLTDCPDFDTNPIYKQQNFQVTIKVIDSLTGLPIDDANVYVIERGEMVGKYETNAKGFVHDELPLGLYYIVAEKIGYLSDYFEGYINFARNYVEIDLPKKERTPEVEVEVVENIDTAEIEEVEMWPLDIVELPDTTDEVVDVTDNFVEEVDTTSLELLPDTLFDNAHFKFNNITFILDASSSMNSQGKMDLLKMAMIELVKILRPEDKVTVLKYAAEVTVLMENESGADKDKIIEIVKGIRTTGITAGGTAINEAYRLNNKYFIPEGNNIVIIITDGAFNSGDQNYDKTIKSNFGSKGIRFSVVGVKTTAYIETNMKNIAALGGGAYIQIHSIEDAQTNIIEEIKRTSFKANNN